MEAVLTGALVLGFIGSAHCVGMCGPLVLAMPFSVQGPGRRWQGMLAYHGGRGGATGSFKRRPGDVHYRRCRYVLYCDMAAYYWRLD